MVILRAMQDAIDNNFPANHAEKYFVGKPMRQDAAKATVVNRKTIRIGFEPEEGFGVVGQKFITQTVALGFIPIVGVAEVGLGF